MVSAGGKGENFFFLFSFVYHWNDYFWPLVMTTDDQVRTLPLGIALLREQGTGVRWHVVMAGNVALSAPALLVFAFAQKPQRAANRANPARRARDTSGRPRYTLESSGPRLFSSRKHASSPRVRSASACTDSRDIVRASASSRRLRASS